jgi:hypothetical protein
VPLGGGLEIDVGEGTTASIVYGASVEAMVEQ